MGREFSTREQWLEAAVDLQRPRFEELGSPLPEKLAVSCSWPSVGGRRVIGECWDPAYSARGFTEMFVSPVMDDPLHPQGPLATLRHELVHATGRRGHRADFRELAVAVGLEGKMTATHAGRRLLREFAEMAKELGAYPHGKLLGSGEIIIPGKPGEKPIVLRPDDQPRKQGTRLLKASCTACGYTIRLSKKWADSGLPSCPKDKLPFVLDMDEKQEPGGLIIPKVA